MSGNSLRYGYVQWASRTIAVLLFSVCVGLYGLPIAVLLALLAACAYCAVSYLSFTPDGHHWRRTLQSGYDKLFSAIYAQPTTTTTTPTKLRGQSSNSGGVAVECHKEAQKMTRLIMRDFVLEWFESVSSDLEFPEDCQKILEHVALEVNSRIQQVNLDELVYELLATVLPYLEAVNQAGRMEYNGVEVFDVKHERCLRRFEENTAVAHRALRSPESEARHYRQVLDTIIQCAVPDEYRNCDIACAFLREVLLQNIVEPLLTLLCDPDFLNEAIPIVLRKADLEAVQVVLDHVREENKTLAQSLLRGRMLYAHRRPPDTRRFHSMSEHYSQTLKPIPVEASTETEGAMPANDNADYGEEVSEVATGSSPPLPQRSPVLLRRDHAYGPSPSPPSPLSSAFRSPSLEKKRVSLPPDSRSSPLLMRRQTIGPISSAHLSRASTVVASGNTAATPSFSAAQETDSDMVYINLPPIFATRYVHIDKGGSTHIGYIFKFPKQMLPPQYLQELEVPPSETHLESVKRYSDFTKFHQQLLRSPLAIYTKGLDLPERHSFANVVSKLPFTSRDLDPTSLLERKQGLEKYIQSISSIQPIMESDIFHDFLMSGVQLLRDASILQPQSQRQVSRRRTILGMMKVHSEEQEEAKPLPRRPMESVLSSYLNTQLPLPCRKLRSPPNPRSAAPKATGSAAPVSKVTRGHTHLREQPSQETEVKRDSGLGRRPSGAPNGVQWKTSQGQLSAQDTFSSSDGEDSLTIGAVNNLPCEGESSYISCKATPTQPDISGVSAPTEGERTPDNAVLTNSSNFFVKLRTLLLTIKTRLLRFYDRISHYVAMVIAFLRVCSQPITRETLDTLTSDQQDRDPLSNVLLSLGTEASKTHCKELWVTDHSTQLAVLTLFGGAIDRFLLHELHLVMEKEENWVRALYHLRHTLWVEGANELNRTPREKLTEDEREERKRKAAESFKKFLPNFLPYLAGPEEYHHAVTHCIECLQNPRINRHFFLRIVDIILPKLVPELHSDRFQKRLSRIRTLTDHHAHKIPHSRSFASHNPGYSKR